MIVKYSLASVALAAFVNTAALAQDAQQDIVAVAAGNQDFETLVAAVEAAGLVDTLKGEGPFTVFAPTDDAFEALPAGTVEELLKPENKDKLAAILTYHVVPGKVMSSARCSPPNSELSYRLAGARPRAGHTGKQTGATAGSPSPILELRYSRDRTQR